MTGFNASHCSLGYILLLGLVSPSFASPDIVIELCPSGPPPAGTDEAAPLKVRIGPEILSSIAIEFMMCES